MLTRYTRPKRSKKPFIILLVVATIITVPVLLYLEIITLESGTAQIQEIIIQPVIVEENIATVTTTTQIEQPSNVPTNQQKILAPLDEAMYGNN